MSFASRLKRIFGRETRLGLVLGSGGARGLAHIGVLTVLKEAGIPIHCIAGTSAGALIGGLYSAGNTPQALEELFGDISISETARLLIPSLSRGGLVDGKRIKRLIKPYTREKAIEELSPRFACVATDLYSGKRVVFRRGDLLESIRASISIPGVFTPVICGDRVLVDGGVVDPLPVGLAFEMGATFVIAVRVNRQDAGGRSDDDQDECIFQGHESKESEREKKGLTPPVLEIILSTTSIYERRLSELNVGKPGKRMIIEPALAGIEILDFHKGRRAIDAGAKAMRERLPEIARRIPRK